MNGNVMSSNRLKASSGRKTYPANSDQTTASRTSIRRAMKHPKIATARRGQQLGLDWRVDTEPREQNSRAGVRRKPSLQQTAFTNLRHCTLLD